MPSVPRPSVPLRAWRPLSAVPPSPAKPTTVTSLIPRASAAARRPEIEAPVASNAQSSMGTSRAVVGNGVPITVQQHAGTVMIVFGPSPLRMYRMTRVAPHPGHAECPDRMYSSAGIVSLATPDHLQAPLEVGPLDLGTARLQEDANIPSIVLGVRSRPPSPATK